MNDPIVIERAELQRIVDQAITRTLKELGIKPKDINPEVTFNHAVTVLGVSRRRLERAMERGTVEWYKEDMEKPHSRIWIKRKSLNRLITRPKNT